MYLAGSEMVPLTGSCEVLKEPLGSVRVLNCSPAERLSVSQEILYYMERIKL
jgi:hypothetical protein